MYILYVYRLAMILSLAKAWRCSKGVQCHLEPLSTKNAGKRSTVIVYPMHGMKNCPLKVNGAQTGVEREQPFVTQAVHWKYILIATVQASLSCLLDFLHPDVYSPFFYSRKFLNLSPSFFTVLIFLSCLLDFFASRCIFTIFFFLRNF